RGLLPRRVAGGGWPAARGTPGRAWRRCPVRRGVALQELRALLAADSLVLAGLDARRATPCRVLAVRPLRPAGHRRSDCRRHHLARPPDDSAPPDACTGRRAGDAGDLRAAAAL